MKKPLDFSPLRRCLVLGTAVVPLAMAGTRMWTAEVLPSWRGGAARDSIIRFVESVVDINGPNYVKPEDRIAVFDNDGTLWSEQPFYFQFYFMADQVRATARLHPEWQSSAAFKALMARDVAALLKVGPKPVMELMAVANAGMSTQEYEASIASWLATSRHPRFNRPYTDLVYQPMRELLNYLEMNLFKNFIVSGGGVEFMRGWTKKAYNIPPERIIGSIGGTVLGEKEGRPVLTRQPTLEFLDDGPGKPVGIYRQIGQQPIFSFGNSDGDLQMLQWTAAAPGASFMGLVHHTDAKREWAYDRKSPVGKLDKAMDEAIAKGWTIVNMKQDWSKVYAFE